MGRGGRPGKLLSLAYLLREHREALEADFQRYYQLDLLDLYRGRISPRRASVLAVKLPQGSATWVEYGGPLAWTGETHFFAKAIDELRLANWQRSKDGSKGTNPPKPIEPPKPSAEAKSQSTRVEARAKAFLKRQQRAAAATPTE